MGIGRINEVVLEPGWWEKYGKKDLPQSWLNPHFEAVYDQASPEKQAVAKMAIGMQKEFSTRRKVAKFNALMDALSRFDVYPPITAQEAFSGNQRYTKIMMAAVMEVFTPTGLYSGRDRWP